MDDRNIIQRLNKMKRITDYKKVFETLVSETQKYIIENGLKAMILGISGGIDSTVCAAICHEVSKRTGIPLIGRSLPSKFNKEGEIDSASLVGKAFCNDFEEVPIKIPYDVFMSVLDRVECGMTPLASGNIQARLRMMYLYHLAGTNKGLVIDTDNLTENNLGYFTIHGDVGDFNPIGGLWKTEVFELAKCIHNDYYNKARCLEEGHFYEEVDKIALKLEAIKKSLELKPTAGLGITDSDLDEIGAESYEQVDSILQEILAWKRLVAERGDEFQDTEDIKNSFLEEQQMFNIPIKVIMNVANKHFASEFKRRKLPVVIIRDLYV